ncbi:Arylsulfatase [Planctomycetes bacterium CA13]|uniref:Arylsulfatase n=1 Tax=Novipirellula herctigrandis TaxID=2527986 RepID=A0A5C5YVU5_9BACT|nr:Arylsulfatase [Planctomycetes bacterium CA13]
MKIFLVGFAMALLTVSSIDAAEPPNIVLFFIDDMGYGDIGPFGNQVNKTPNLDQMAREGNVLRQFYVANTACTPSRSALMTGTYASRIGMDGDVCFPAEERGLNPTEITIAEMLKAEGYATGCFGKWHLGDQTEFMPLAQGFDEYFGIPYSNDMWPGNLKGHRHFKQPYTPLPVLHQDKVVAYVSDGADQSLLCQVVTDYTVKFIDDHKDEPFFCYVPHAYVHHPRFARPEILRKAGGDVNRANVEEVDTGVGRVLDKIRDLKLDQQTLVIFTSDNGGAGGMSMGPLRGGKGGPKYEGHMREPTITWWPGRIPAGIESNGIGVTTDLLPSLARLVGGDVPTDRKIDGKDALDILLGKPGAKSPHHLHFYEVDGIRRGPWKLVRIGNKTELYNLDTDLGERNNVAKQNPKISHELSELLDVHVATIIADTRPAGFVKPGTAKPLLSEPGELPKLRDFMGLPETTAIGAPRKKAESKNNGKAKKKPKAMLDAARNRKPNFVLILADDQGWNGWSTAMDPRIPDSKSDFYRTPNLDRRVSGGMRFSRGYAPAPVCSPTRHSIQFGVSPAKTRITHNSPTPKQHCAPKVSLANLSKKASPDYTTAHFGNKWHVSAAPMACGYDQSDGATGNRDGDTSNDPNDPKRVYDVTERSVSFMEQAVSQGQPFFLQVSHDADHLTFKSSVGMPEKFADIPVGKRHHDRKCAGMNGDLDQGVGSILDAIDRLAITDRTYVFYFADIRSDQSNDKLHGIARRKAWPRSYSKGFVPEGGVRVPFVVCGPGVQPGAVSRTPVIAYELLPTCMELINPEIPLPNVVEGGSMLSVLYNRGEGLVKRPNDCMVFHYPTGVWPAQSSLVQGDWKLVKSWAFDRVKLFNLA